ncbi:MAG: hypothetical protein RIG63_12650 [Coleofasciculus chthonoplastes F3-SA18-01]
MPIPLWIERITILKDVAGYAWNSMQIAVRSRPRLWHYTMTQ